MLLAGKAALITGSTSGIGKALAEAFAGAGAGIVLNGFGEADAVETQRAMLEKRYQVKVSYRHADLARREEVEAMMTAARAEHGRIDILINNAGIQHVADIVAFPPERWDAIIAVNLSAAFHTTRLALPAMRRTGWGRIVNIASVHGLVASRHKAAYVAAKHGVVGLTKNGALEYGPHNIRINSVAPGAVDTPMLRGAIEQFNLDPVEYPKQLSVLERFAQPEEIAQATLWLASDYSSYVTGTTVHVDGGYTSM